MQQLAVARWPDVGSVRCNTRSRSWLDASATVRERPSRHRPFTPVAPMRAAAVRGRPRDDDRKRSWRDRSETAERLLARNQIFEEFFAREAHRLAVACREMSERFLRGGRLLAFGRGPYATDAQHVSVEFVHPSSWASARCPRSISPSLFGPWLEAMLRPTISSWGSGRRKAIARSRPRCNRRARAGP